MSKKATPAVYPFELKLDLVQRFLAGETLAELAEEGGLSSPVLLRRWVREYRAHGEDALRPKPKGRPAKNTVTGEEPELDRLRREVEYLRAENAYLGKLRALMEEKRRTR
ncbi:transposase [Rhodococcus sp. ACT016]|uniref:transposase n=1 Tax=Rhodococcus sp. ACT016 TaxID=3134808 RepID=UPI003D2801C4